MNSTSSLVGVKLSHADRILFPGDRISKYDLARYYRRIASRMLPLIKDRPLTLQRFPGGIREDGFFQKQRSRDFPKFIHSVELGNRSREGTTDYMLCNNLRSLVFFIQMDTVCLHSWLSQVERPDHPDRLIFDLDPPSVERFDLVRRAARVLGRMLRDRGLHPYLMTTGSRGLHLIVPLRPGVDFDTSRAFAREIAEQVASEHPDDFTTEVRKAKRGARLFLDTARNAWGQTAVAPYSVRALEGAPIATPIDWRELDRSGLGAQSYHLGNIWRRLGQKSDPWRQMRRYASHL